MGPLPKVWEAGGEQKRYVTTGSGPSKGGSISSSFPLPYLEHRLVTTTRYARATTRYNDASGMKELRALAQPGLHVSSRPTPRDITLQRTISRGYFRPLSLFYSNSHVQSYLILTSIKLAQKINIIQADVCQSVQNNLLPHI